MYFQIVTGKFLFANLKCTYIVYVRLFTHNKCVVDSTIIVVNQPKEMPQFD